RTHGIEGVRGAACTGLDRCARLGCKRLRVSQRTAHAHACRVSDELRRSVQLRRDRHQANVSACSPLKAVEEFDAGFLQTPLRVNAAFDVREKRTFEMDAARLCLQRLRLSL